MAIARQVYNLIQHFVDIDHYEQARKLCLEALEDDPKNWWMLDTLAWLCHKLKDHKACLQAGLSALNYETPDNQARTFDTL